jgi:hypothetical protein
MYFVVAASESRTGRRTQPGKIARGRVDGLGSCSGLSQGQRTKRHEFPTGGSVDEHIGTPQTWSRRESSRTGGGTRHSVAARNLRLLRRQHQLCPELVLSMQSVQPRLSHQPKLSEGFPFRFSTNCDQWPGRTGILCDFWNFGFGLRLVTGSRSVSPEMRLVTAFGDVVRNLWSLPSHKLLHLLARSASSRVFRKELFSRHGQPWRPWLACLVFCTVPFLCCVAAWILVPSSAQLETWRSGKRSLLSTSPPPWLSTD